MSKQPFSVLLVDDDVDTCEIFQLVMNHNHLSSIIINSAEAAMDYLENNRPDIIVMDLFLPGIDGYRALDMIRQNANSANIIVIATTAYYTSNTQQEVVERGFNGYLPKPFVGDTLIPFLNDLRL